MLEQTRGFAVQLIFEGRGVKIYWDKEYPELRIRMGVGTKELNLKHYVLFDPDCMVHITRAVDILVIHGPTKDRVGAFASLFMKRVKAYVYT